MEKIYDEAEQQKRKKQQKKKIKIDGVTMLSFAVALLAIVSLVAAGISGVSFALPNDVVNYPEEFDGIDPDDVVMYDQSTRADVTFSHYNDGTNDIPLLCLQRDVGFTAGHFTETDSGFVSDDTGLLYLISKLAPYSSFTYPSGFNKPSSLDQKYVDYWISQMAVWYYLDGKANNQNTSMRMSQLFDAGYVGVGTGANYDEAESAAHTAGEGEPNDADRYFGFSDGKKIFDEVKVGTQSIKQIINEAKSKTGMSYAINVAKGEEAVSYDDNKEYYFSPLFTVTAQIDNTVGELSSYAITIKAHDQEDETVDVNAVVVDKQGNVINNLNNVSLSELSQFYVRVPVNKVTKNVDIEVGVQGTFRMYDGKRYKVAGQSDSQEVTALSFVNKSTSHGSNFSLAPAPDTGISAGQAIYFVGLIVLLCGVGIIYANAKPTAKAQN